MQGEKEMKGKVLTPTEWKVSTPTLTYGLTDWRSHKLQELHMLYGTKNLHYIYFSIQVFLLLQIRIPLRITNFIFQWSSGENTKYFPQYLSCPLIKRLWGVLLYKTFIESD